MNDRQAKFEYYEADVQRDERNKEPVQSEWRWRLRAANGEIVASGEGYVDEDGVKEGVEAVVRAVDGATRYSPEVDLYRPDSWRVEKVEQ